LDHPFANKWLNIAILWEMTLLLLIVYLSFLHIPFNTLSLTLTDWAIILAVAFSITPVLEFMKWLERRGWFGELV